MYELMPLMVTGVYHIRWRDTLNMVMWYFKGWGGVYHVRIDAVDGHWGISYTVA